MREYVSPVMENLTSNMEAVSLNSGHGDVPPGGGSGCYLYFTNHDGGSHSVLMMHVVFDKTYPTEYFRAKVKYYKTNGNTLVATDQDGQAGYGYLKLGDDNTAISVIGNCHFNPRDVRDGIQFGSLIFEKDGKRGAYDGLSGDAGNCIASAFYVETIEFGNTPFTHFF